MTSGASVTKRADLADALRRYKLPAGDTPIEQMVVLAEVTLHSVIEDVAVWQEEAARTDAAPLPWPLADARDPYVQWMQLFAEATVATCIDAMKEAGWIRADLAMPKGEQVNDALFQRILRVTWRAVDATHLAIVKEFGNHTGRLTGTREVKNWMKVREIERLQREKRLSVADAASEAGISTAAAYRLLGRGRRARAPW